MKLSVDPKIIPHLQAVSERTGRPITKLMNEMLLAMLDLMDVTDAKQALPFHEFGEDDNFTCPECGAQVEMDHITIMGTTITLCWCLNLKDCGNMFFASVEE